jgi:hypothetical protein
MNKLIARLTSRIETAFSCMRRAGKAFVLKSRSKGLRRVWWIAATVGIVALVILLALLTLTPESTLPPTPSPPTSQQTPVASSTSPPSLTIPPEIEKGLLIPNYSDYVDTFGFLHIVGEVENISTNNTEENQITVTFIDTEGNPIINASTYTYLDIITPGQRSPFEILLSSSPIAKNFILETTWQISEEEPYIDIEIESESLQLYEEGWYRIVGQLKNSGNKTVDSAIVVATFYNATGQVVGVGFAFSDVFPLGAGESSSFAILIAPIIIDTMDTYLLQVEVTCPPLTIPGIISQKGG